MLHKSRDLWLSDLLYLQPSRSPNQSLHRQSVSCKVRKKKQFRLGVVQRRVFLNNNHCCMSLLTINMDLKPPMHPQKYGPPSFIDPWAYERCDNEQSRYNAPPTYQKLAPLVSRPTQLNLQCPYNGLRWTDQSGPTQYAARSTGTYSAQQPPFSMTMTPLYARSLDSTGDTQWQHQKQDLQPAHSSQM